MGLTGNVNVQGEKVQKLDTLSNNIFINTLKTSNTVSLMVSEEIDEIIRVDNGNNGRYNIVFDPLDGSSNIDTGVTIGTIFGIFHNQQGKTDDASILCPGHEMIAAGYALYGSFTMIVMALGNGPVNGYTLDPVRNSINQKLQIFILFYFRVWEIFFSLIPKCQFQIRDQFIPLMKEIIIFGILIVYHLLII